MVFLRRLLTLILGSALVARLIALLKGRQERRTSPQLRPVPVRTETSVQTAAVPEPEPGAAEPEAAEPGPEPEPEATEPGLEPEPEAAEPEPEPEAAEPEAAEPGSRPGAAWTEPVDEACPAGFPVKVKLSSGIYHEPGGTHYERTQPDRCYTNAAAAEADGFRASRS